MKRSKPRRRLAGQSRRRPAVLLMLVGVALLCGVGVAISRRSRSTAQLGEEAEGGWEDSTVGRPEDAVEHPLIGHEFRLLGDRFRVLESARNKADESLRFEYFARPGASVPKHVQPDLEERFEVVSGRMGVRVGGRELLLSANQSAVGPPGVPHEWWNLSDEEEVHMLVEVRPALHVESLLETWVGLGRDGKAIRGIPKNPPQLAVLVHEVGSWVYFVGPMLPVWKTFFALLRPLVFVGKLFGYRARYPEYSGSAKRRDG
jgi:mannose-6-phosphate isomerase-like protein (cupin superfamily)